jgi:hypothetical protein
MMLWSCVYLGFMVRGRGVCGLLRAQILYIQWWKTPTKKKRRALKWIASATEHSGEATRRVIHQLFNPLLTLP